MLRELADWVWLPGHNSREWEKIFDLLERALKRQRGRFSWATNDIGARTFVSYSFHDYDLAAKVVDRLVTWGLDVFFADETTLMNSPLRDELTRLIDDCDVFVPVITAEYRNSNWCYIEAEFATERFRQSAKPDILVVALDGERVPRWYSRFPVCRDLERLEGALTNR